MPFYISLIRWYYLFLTLLAIIAPLNYSLWQFLPSFVLLWLSYFLFKKGCIKGMRKSVAPVSIRGKHDLSKFFLVFTLGMIVFIPLYVRFYTGGNLANLAVGFYSNVGADSNYQEYQRYFMENNLGQFSIDKLPYIIGYGIAKLLFYFFIFSYVGYTKKISKTNVVLIVILFILYSMVGMARGTSFENFELLILLTFSLLVRAKVIENRNFFSRSQLIKISIVLVVIGSAFLVSKALRSGKGALEGLSGPSDTLSYDSSSLIMSLFPMVGKISLGFTGYFTFGLYYTSELFWKIWTSSFTGLFDMLFPLFAQYVEGIDGYRAELITRGVDCAACWDPDFSVFSFYFGLPLLFFIIYNLGVISGKSYNKSYMNRDVGHCLVLFIIVYEMLSLHVGNFLVVSSSNKIMLVVVFAVIYFNKFKEYRIK